MWVYELIAAGGATALFLLYYLFGQGRRSPPQLPPLEHQGWPDPPPPSPRIRVADEVDPTPPPTAPPPPKLSEAEQIEAVVVHASFMERKVEAGVREVGTRLVEERLVESPVPADEWDVRTVRGPHEFSQLLPSERTVGPELGFIRLMAGESLVAAHFERNAVYEPVYEPVYRTLKTGMYVLFDISRSMWDDRWRSTLGKGVVKGLAQQAVAGEATLLFRWFAGKVSRQRRVTDEASLTNFIRYVGELSSDESGTDIGRALDWAVKDCTEEGWERAHVMIVTDGEDNSLRIQEMRAKLDAAGMRLHAVLLGVQNDALRELADLYQQIPERGRLGDLIVRRPPTA